MNVRSYDFNELRWIGSQPEDTTKDSAFKRFTKCYENVVLILMPKITRRFKSLILGCSSGGPFRDTTKKCPVLQVCKEDTRVNISIPFNRKLSAVRTDSIDIISWQKLQVDLVTLRDPSRNTCRVSGGSVKSLPSALLRSWMLRCTLNEHRTS